MDTSNVIDDTMPDSIGPRKKPTIPPAPELHKWIATSVVKKQMVALTGLMFVGFVFGHMAGNFLLFGGPDAFNGYADKLQSLGPLLWAARLSLIAALIVHVSLTIMVTLENRAARGLRYAVRDDFGQTNIAKRTMIYTGLLFFCFLLLHLTDFTFGDKTGAASVVAGANNGESLGLFGLVWNSFLKPWRVVVYMTAVSIVGLHVSHGVQSTLQTLGLPHDRYMTAIKRLSNAIGLLVALGFSSIPAYVIIRHLTTGLGAMQ